MLALTLALPFAASAEPTGLLRTDGVPVKLMEPGALEAELALHSRNAVPFERFSDEFVKHALATGIDWRTKGAVTPAKDQGAHGYAQCSEPAGAAAPHPVRRLISARGCTRYCGTFGRTCAFEGQYAIHSGHGLRNFSEEQLVECIGWTKDQYGYVAGTADGTPGHGFEDMAVYPPYVEAGYKDTNPPIPGHPCKYDKSKIIVGTDNGWVRLKCRAFVLLPRHFLVAVTVISQHTTLIV